MSPKTISRGSEVWFGWNFVKSLYFMNYIYFCRMSQHPKVFHDTQILLRWLTNEKIVKLEEKISWKCVKMIANIRARRIIITALVTSSLALALVLILIPSPDLSLEQELQRQISHLSLRIEHAEKINVERKDDLQRLFQQFSRITHNLLKVRKITQCARNRNEIHSHLENISWN